MTFNDWIRKFGEVPMIALTDEERRYLGLCQISSAWDTQMYFSKTNLWYTKVTAFFDGDTIVKVISEVKKVLNNGVIAYESYVEDDTNLLTAERTQLLPLTNRGKPKRLTASNINAVMPFGCSLAIVWEIQRDSFVLLRNPRANKDFPIGERDRVQSIKTESDFHDFMKTYIETCRDDYFDKLQAFKSAKKVTVKYRVGDIFRMELDRTRYCYGIITGDVKKLKAMHELPESHSLRQLMMVPIMVRYYQLITQDSDLGAEELCDVPLGRVEVVGDNDIIWGTHTIVAHKQIEPDDLEFNFVCTKIAFRSPHTTLFTQDFLMKDGLMPRKEYTLYIEWGFANTSLNYDQLSEKLKEFLVDYYSPHGGVSMGIDPYNAEPDEKRRQYESYRKNLLNPENREFLNEIFACLGLGADTTFDQFAEKFGGLTLREIATRMK